MPPRRSTRSSSRLSVEPENQPPPQRSTPPSKRKRFSGESIDNEEHEDYVKPPSRTTRRSSSSKAPTPAPTSRTSYRSKNALRQVQGGDDDDDDDGEPPHPAKKSRPSPELEDVHEEDEEDVKPIIRPRTRRAAATSSASLRRGGRPSRSTAVSVKAEPLDQPTLGNIDDEGGEEDEISITSKRRTAKPPSRKAKSLTLPSTEDDDFVPDVHLDEKKAKDSSNREPVLSDDDGPTPVPSPKKLPPTVSVVYEEEKSLLDDLPVSPAKARHAPPLEEPKGPHARLVIHKLVLVNFKSYAGRQEIGPFHKVSCFRSMASSLISGSLSLQSSGPMVLANPIPSMRCSSCSDTVLPKCDKENSPSSYTTPLNTLI